MRNKKMVIAITGVIGFVAIAIIAVGAVLFFNSNSWEMLKTNVESQYSGDGIERTIVVENNKGEVIQEYSGEIYIDSYKENKLTILVDGKKHVLYISPLNNVYIEEEE